MTTSVSLTVARTARSLAGGTLPGGLACIGLLGGISTADAETAHFPDTFFSVQEAPDTVPESIPGYETTVRYLQSLERRADDAPAEEMQIGGGLDLSLVVNETQSPTGQEFFDVFYSAWEAPQEVGSFTIRIQEQPIQGLYTRVQIVLDDEPLVQIPLEPRRAFIEDIAQRATAYVRDLLLERSAGPGGR